jgi:Ca2+-binding RTX toxin-like protein
MAVRIGNDSDNRLRGTSESDTLRGRDGNDTLEGLLGLDLLLGGKGDDQLFGGTNADVLSGDGDFTATDNLEKGNDILIGGGGTDSLIAWGDDILVGAGPNRYNAQLITDLQNDPFATSILGDGEIDTFIATNKDEIGYTLTIADYEVDIDKIDLSAFGVSSASDFIEIQDKGSFFELKTPKVNNAEIVLRINADPTLLTYIGVDPTLPIDIGVDPTLPTDIGVDPTLLTYIGNDSDNRLRGTSGADTIRGRGGNDTLEGFAGLDLLLGGKNDDQLFGGANADILSGDGEFTATDNLEKGNDVLIGGSGTDSLIAWGDDILVGAGPNQYNAQLITDLKNDPFATFILGDGEIDTFIATNKDGVGYTLTIADYEVGIDNIDLSAFGVSSASDFIEVQDKGSFFELKTPKVNNAEIVLRINVDPTLLTYI